MRWWIELKESSKEETELQKRQGELAKKEKKKLQAILEEWLYFSGDIRSFKV